MPGRGIGRERRTGETERAMTDDGPTSDGPSPTEAAQDRPQVARTDIARATFLLMLPMLAVTIAAVVMTSLPLTYAVGGIVVVSAGTAVLIRRHFQGLTMLRHRLEARVTADDPIQALTARRTAGIDDIGPTADLALALERADRRLLDLLSAADRETTFRASVIDSIPDPLLLIDARSRIAMANHAARGQFGAAVVGRDLSVVIRHPDVLVAVRRALADGDAGEVEFALAAPVQRTFNLRVQSIPESEGQAASALMLFVDLSAVRRAEQMRVDFVANVSHELRTPLATLLGFIETLQGPAREDTEARDRFLGIMRAQANRMSRLVNDLLSLSRIETNEHSPPKERVALSQLLDTVKATLDLEARRKDMRVKLEIEDNLPEVVGEEDELAQVIQNLLDNAIKYSRPGTEVVVSAFRTSDLPASYLGPRGPAVAVAVRDRGEGIAAEHLPRLTERFYRVDTARSRELGGTGLGLAIVKHIVNRHRGALSVESMINEGSTFTVYLPAAASRTNAQDVTAA